MGLDSVEFVIALEESFGLAISDADARRLRTPRDVIDHLTTTLPTAPAGPCLSQRAFYRLRRGLRSHAAISRDAVVPDADLDALVPRDTRAQVWDRIRADLGAPRLPSPPSRPEWIRKVIGPGRARPRDVVRYAVAYAPQPLLDGQPWTRTQITQVVRALCEEEFGVDMRRFTLDSEFVRDMGVD